MQCAIEMHLSCIFSSLQSFEIVSYEFVNMHISKYSDLPNNRAANLIIVWGKNHLYTLIKTYTQYGSIKNVGIFPLVRLYILVHNTNFPPLFLKIGDIY